ncbi:hypothetical protein OQA88_4867 [Cercophora sp. LCS_1]
MASAELTVAKAALTGALFRADPRSCSRDEIDSMIALLNTAIVECSPSNVQKFKQWALSNLVPSSSRIAPFCRYLVALTSSFGRETDISRDATQFKRGRVPSAKRRRLHVLYVLNDILYHVKFRNYDEAFAEKLVPSLASLIRSASSFSNAPKHIGKIQNLIDLWRERGYFHPSIIDNLLNSVNQTPPAKDSISSDAQLASVKSVTKIGKAVPFLMPAMHGDPNTPWYDLPAGNWLQALEPNSTRPMNPSMIKPLVLAAGPAEKGLVEAVKKLLVDVDKIYSRDLNPSEAFPDVSQMGEYVEVDEVNGEVIDGETYYGWSRAFCEKMKARKRGGGNAAGRGRNRDRSRIHKHKNRYLCPILSLRSQCRVKQVSDKALFHPHHRQTTKARGHLRHRSQCLVNHHHPTFLQQYHFNLPSLAAGGPTNRHRRLRHTTMGTTKGAVEGTVEEEADIIGAERGGKRRVS